MNVKIKITISVVALAFLTLSCGQVQQHRQAGDRHLSAQEYEQAFYEYERALNLKPKLQQDKKFIAQYKVAKASAFLNRARKAVEDEDWHEAIRCYRLSLEAKEEQSTRAELSQALGRASRFRYQESLILADQGKLQECIVALRKAAEFDSNNPDVSNALNNTELPDVIISGTAWELYKRGKDFSSEKRWIQALDAFSGAVSVDQNQILARVSRHEVNDVLERVRQVEADGMSALRQKDLDRAIEKAKAALETYPYFDQAKDLLSQAQDLKNKAEAEYEQAVAELSNQNFDQAITKLNQVIDTYPKHSSANQQLEEAQKEAASFHTQKGEEALQRNETEQAKASFHTALSYVRDFLPASKDLSNCYLGLAKKNWSQKQYGSTLLFAARALDFNASNSEAEALTKQAHEKILEQCKYKVALEIGDVREDQRNIAIVKQALIQEFQKKAPKNLELEMTDNVLQLLGKIAREKDEKELEALQPPVYSISIQTEELRVHTPMPQPQTLSKRYQSGTKQYPNPTYTNKLVELSRLTGHSDALDQQMLANQMMIMQREQAYQDRKLHRRIIERTTGRSGLWGSVDNVMLQSDATTDTMSHSSSQITQSMENMGAAFSKMETNRRIRTLETELETTPAYLEEPIYDYWQYQIETHSKTARASLLCEVTSLADQKLIFSGPFEETATAEDKVTQNARPDIGIPYDTLNMPSDIELRERTLKPVIFKLSETSLVAIQKDWANRFLSNGAQSYEAGDSNTAAEAFVKFLLCVPASPETTKETEAAVTWLGKHLELDNLPDEFSMRYSFMFANLKQTQQSSVVSLGVKLEPLTAELRKFFNFNGDGGMVVTAVQRDSLAEAIDLKWGDIITEIDSTPIRDAATLRAQLEQPTTHSLRIFRAGVAKSITISANLATNEARSIESSPPTVPDIDSEMSTTSAESDIEHSAFGTALGLELKELTADSAKFLDIEGKSGIVVTRVEKGGWGSQVGFRWGDLITNVFGIDVSTVEELDEVLSKRRGEKTSFGFIRSGSYNTLTVQLPK